MNIPNMVSLNVVYADYINDRTFRSVLSVLCDDMKCDTTIDALKNAMTSQPVATVTDRVTDEQQHVPERRRGHRYTFGKDAVAKLNVIVASDLMFSSFMSVEPTHGDVLLYQEGDYFHWHRDTVPLSPPSVNAKYYTLLVGLNTTDIGGETEIMYTDKRVHKFDNTCCQRGYMLFPSEELHRGTSIIKGYKMVLKLDYWISTADMRSISYPCDCVLCIADQKNEYEERDDDDSWCNGYHLDD
jgi:hypothetical protein